MTSGMGFINFYHIPKTSVSYRPDVSTIQQDSASDRGNMEHCLLVWMKGGTLKSPESLRPRRSCKSSQSKGDHKGMGGDQQLSMEAVIGNWFKQQKYHWNLL